MCCLSVSLLRILVFFWYNLLNIVAWRARRFSLIEHLHLHPTSPYTASKKTQIWFQSESTGACLANQTLFCLVSQPGWLACCREAPWGTTEGNKTHTYTVTHTLPSFKQLQMALILRPLSFTIYQVTYSERACLLFMLCWDDLMLLRFIRRGKKIKVEQH